LRTRTNEELRVDDDVDAKTWPGDAPNHAVAPAPFDLSNAVGPGRDYRKGRSRDAPAIAPPARHTNPP
jgi:hypothetical protein